jgi:hypothetical protein
MKYRRCVNEHHNPYKPSQMAAIEADHVSTKLTSREDTINLFHSQETTTPDTHKTQPTASARPPPRHATTSPPPLPSPRTPISPRPPAYHRVAAYPTLPYPRKQNNLYADKPPATYKGTASSSITRRSRSRPSERAREIAPPVAIAVAARRMHARMHVSAPADGTASQASPCIGVAHLVSQPRE